MSYLNQILLPETGGELKLHIINTQVGPDTLLRNTSNKLASKIKETIPYKIPTMLSAHFLPGYVIKKYINKSVPGSITIPIYLFANF